MNIEDFIRNKLRLSKQLKVVLDRKIANPPSKEEIEATIKRFEGQQEKLWKDRATE